MADGDDVVPPDEQHDLVDVDHLFVVHVAGRLQHHEQVVAVALELRPLVGVDGVLDGEGVEVEGAGDVVELVRRGLVQTDPDEAATAPADAQRVLQGDERRAARPQRSGYTGERRRAPPALPRQRLGSNPLWVASS